MHPEEERPTLAPNPPNKRSNPLRVSGLFTSAALVLASFSGCGIFSPDKGDGGGVEPPPVYPILERPERVLQALRIAYEARDSVGYKTLYDLTYIGESVDQNDPPGTNPSIFRHADEVAHIAKLRQSPEVTQVVFDLGPEASWDRLTSSDPSHPEWSLIQITNVNIEVFLGADNSLKASTGDGVFIEFHFVPSTPESSSPTDTLWKIVRWRESRSAGN